MKKGFCLQCSTMVDAVGDSHTRPEHDPGCLGGCVNCPVPVECGPVVYGGCEVCSNPNVPPRINICEACLHAVN